MDRIVEENLNLVAIVKHQVDLYVGEAHEAQIYGLSDDNRQIYAAILVPEKTKERPAWAVVMAQVIEDYVVILEETAIDKPLVEALIKNGGIPREKIILAYAGEKLPD
jgi:hypothetical protein